MNEEIKLREKLKEKYKHLKIVRDAMKEAENFEMEIGTEKEYIDAGIKKWKETDLLKDGNVDIETEKYIEELDERIDFSKPVHVDKKTFSDGLAMLTTKFEEENSAMGWSVGSNEVIIHSRNSRIEIPMNVFLNFVNKYMKAASKKNREDVIIKW